MVFNVEVKPINIKIYTSSAFNFKLSVQRGKQDAELTAQKTAARSMKNTDVKTMNFTESWTFPCTYFIKEGVPDEKFCTFRVIKVLPDGKEVVIAVKEVNLSMNFGK